MAGHDLLTLEIINDAEIFLLREQLRRRIHHQPILHASQSRLEIADLAFNATLNLVNDFLKVKGLTVTTKEGKDGR